MALFDAAQQLFVLRRLPFERLAYPRWQSAAAVALSGALSGLDPTLRAGTLPMPLWLSVPFAAASTWVGLLVVVLMLDWWLRRGGRWDGRGDLFNLMAAAWLGVNLLGACATVLGLPSWLTVTLGLYAIGVGANALSGAIARASLGYAAGGIVLSLSPLTITWFLTMGLAWLVTYALEIGRLDAAG